jgi:hypothetical protein
LIVAEHLESGRVMLMKMITQLIAVLDTQEMAAAMSLGARVWASGPFAEQESFKESRETTPYYLEQMRKERGEL